MKNFATIAIPALLLVTGISYVGIKKFSAKRELNHLYHLGLKPVYDKNNRFYPLAELNYYDSLLRTPLLHRELFKVFQLKSSALLKMGREKEAVEILEEICKTIIDKHDKFSEDVKKDLALAYLRLGERNNCVRNHSSGSCIFPVQGSGIYSDPSAINKGIQIYQRILEHDSSDLTSRWLLNVAYMTIGEYPGMLPSRWLIPDLDNDTSMYKVNPFRDLAADLELNGAANTAGGSIVDDFNNDGYLDIITSSYGLDEGMHYYKNNGDGSFTDVSEFSGLSAIKGGLNLKQADFDNDGNLDILVLRGGWMKEFGKQPNTLLKNNGDGTFTDVTIESGVLSFHPTQTATWADFNNDGWLDLYIGNETVSDDHPHPAELYINNQDGSFTNVAKESGCSIMGFIKGVVSADYNKDGWPDIFISCYDGKRILLKNKAVKSKIPEFTDATHEAGLDKDKTSTFPTWFWDYDNDGWPDIFVCGYDTKKSMAATVAAEALHLHTADSSEMYLYRNNHDGTFTNVSRRAGLNKPVFAMGSNFGDIDNDGWLDMYLGTGDPDFKSLIPNKLFLNESGQQFVDVTSSARVGNLQKGHGLAFADINNDGNQDIFIRVGGVLPGDAYFNSFYVNPGQNQNNWISVLLVGERSNRSAIGAQIAVKITEGEIKRTTYMEINSGGSFGANPFRKEIGIGRAKKIDELIITWPTSGIIQTFKNVMPNQFIKITEGIDQIEKMTLKKLTFKSCHTVTKMIDCFPVILHK